LTKVEKTIEIQAPSQKIWEMLTLDKLPEWQTGFIQEEIKSVKYTSKINTQKDKYKKGSTAIGIPKKQEDPINCHFEIIESIENNKITHRIWEKVYHGTMSIFTTYTLESICKGTKVIFEAKLEMPWGIFGKIIEPFLVRSGSKNYDRSLENLKNLLEN